MVAIAAAVCDVPEVCGRPCREDSVINVPTNSISSSSGMTLCEEGDLSYKIQLAAYKESTYLDASTMNELIAIAAAVCDVPEVCGRPCRDESQSNNQVSNFDPVQDLGRIENLFP